ncbi:hypothetical protein T4B_13568 [Trichinella pseudospiralis]|uniref:Uncharacterized protein n=1 Tax=Trichinella pseudospiralis TaxID=6337 RepID=A0A0V1GPH0_TRIPS|nr:hypothetical protein T4B_13568 [Trichinella pseudospiralis]
MKTIPEKTKWGVVLMESKNTTEKVIEKIASQNGSAPSTNGHSCGWQKNSTQTGKTPALRSIFYSTGGAKICGDNGTRPDNKRAQYGEKSTSVITKRAHGCIEKEMGITLGIQCKANSTMQQGELSGY